MTYTRVVAARFGGPDVLRVETDGAPPTPGRGQARVRLEAAGIGYTDTIIRRGKYPTYRGPTPFVPGYDMVGRVDAVGAGVADDLVGRRVADMCVVGGYASDVVRPAASLVTVRADMDAAVAVLTPLIWMTAWQMLTRLHRLAPCSAVLVTGASGGVGDALCEIGRHLGLRVIGTCSAARAAQVEARGAVAIDRRDPDLVQRVRAVAGGGVAAAFDAIGGEVARQAHACLAPEGLFVSYGAQALIDGRSSLPAAATDLFRTLVGWNLPQRLRGLPGSRLYLIVLERLLHPGWFREDLRTLCDLLATGGLRAPELERIGFDGVRAAHAGLEAGSPPHKFVITP